MTHSPVFSVWTSTSSLKDPEAESALEEDVNPESVPSTEFRKIKQCNGLEENTTVPYTIDRLIVIDRLKFVNSIF